MCLLQGAWRGAPCAVKFTVCDTADEKALQQATREIVLSKRLSHPHVVSRQVRQPITMFMQLHSLHAVTDAGSDLPCSFITPSIIADCRHRHMHGPSAGLGSSRTIR